MAHPGQADRVAAWVFWWAGNRRNPRHIRLGKWVKGVLEVPATLVGVLLLRLARLERAITFLVKMVIEIGMSSAPHAVIRDIAEPFIVIIGQVLHQHDQPQRYVPGVPDLFAKRRKAGYPPNSMMNSAQSSQFCISGAMVPLMS